MMLLSVIYGMLVPTALAYTFQCPDICICSSIDISADCQNSDLRRLPEGLHEETLSLDLSYNKFTTIPANISSLKQLQILIMAHNEISALDQDTFNEMENLEILDLSSNAFTDWGVIHPASLVPLKALKQLDLSHNRLRGFPAILEYPLRSDTLKRFILNNCSIINAYGDILAGMVNVEKLVLSNNPLTTLNTQLRSENLKILDLSNCAIQRISVDAIWDLPNLESLIMSNNIYLKKFNSKSKSLKSLDLNNCSIESYPANSLSNLTHIYLRNNQLKYLPANAFSSTPLLQVLSISHNAISIVDEKAFVNLPYVRIVDLSYNTISQIYSETFSLNSNLAKLYLSYNYLSDVGHIVSDSLRVLDMSVCEIRTVSRDSLQTMPRLEELNLSRNLISSLPDDWSADNLQLLDLSLCRIYTLTNATFRAMPSLRNLNLAGNRLTSSIKPAYFHDINVVRLDDNSWLCDCKSPNFRDLYDYLINRMHSTTQMRCMFPESLAGMPWELACEDYWYTQQARSDRVWIFSVVLLVATIILLCVVISIRRAYQLKEFQEREIQERERMEVRERLRRMQEQQYQVQEEETQRNAPDPREQQRPPPYAEAILMPRLDGSYSSLAGSQHSLSGSQRNLSGSRHSLRGSQHDIANGKVRRKRRRSKNRRKAESADTSGDDQHTEHLSLEEGTSENETTRRRERENRSQVIESDL